MLRWTKRKSIWHLVIELGQQGPNPEERPSEPELMQLRSVAISEEPGWRGASDGEHSS